MQEVTKLPEAGREEMLGERRGKRFFKRYYEATIAKIEDEIRVNSQKKNWSSSKKRERLERRLELFKSEYAKARRDYARSKRR